MSNPCNCYYGEDCTKTTVCAINAALEDQADEIEHMQKVIDRVARIRLDLESENRRLSTEGGVAEERFAQAMRCINQIDDYLEYRWKRHDAQRVRDYVMNYIDVFTDSVSGKQK